MARRRASCGSRTAPPNRGPYRSGRPNRASSAALSREWPQARRRCAPPVHRPTAVRARPGATSNENEPGWRSRAVRHSSRPAAGLRCRGSGGKLTTTDRLRPIATLLVKCRQQVTMSTSDAESTDPPCSVPVGRRLPAPEPSLQGPCPLPANFFARDLPLVTDSRSSGGRFGRGNVTRVTSPACGQKKGVERPPTFDPCASPASAWPAPVPNLADV